MSTQTPQRTPCRRRVSFVFELGGFIFSVRDVWCLRLLLGLVSPVFSFFSPRGLEFVRGVSFVCSSVCCTWARLSTPRSHTYTQSREHTRCLGLSYLYVQIKSDVCGQAWPGSVWVCLGFCSWAVFLSRLGRSWRFGSSRASMPCCWVLG